MALVIVTDECMRCGKCVSACPSEAISQQDKAYVIDPNRCTECKDCKLSCSAGCIYHPDDL